jgi:hypothetical protein
MLKRLGIDVRVRGVGSGAMALQPSAQMTVEIWTQLIHVSRPGDERVYRRIVAFIGPGR